MVAAGTTLVVFYANQSARFVPIVFAGYFGQFFVGGGWVVGFLSGQLAL
jgi:hypothetical protein